MYEKLLDLLIQFLEAEKLFEKNHKSQTGALFEEFSISEMHCVDFIFKTELPNVTKLSEKMNITKGGVSKIIKKLIEKNAIESFSVDTNKKEIYYKLTNKGKKIFKLHKNIHEKWCEINLEFFKNCSKEEIKYTILFLEKYIQYLKK
ncbi:TPA: MarR family transcriptional regulator [Candidatus Galligastranaerophilus gallistercoris]|nr:MarR family transcriptional regulator [Candidatus Galligastranaerophilus gallistercoris]